MPQIRLRRGVDRLDYTKGIDNRIKAFDLLAFEPQRVSLLQIATPSRGDIQAYSEYGRDVERLVNQVNIWHGTDEWMPIIYENRSFTQAEIAGLYRAARVCVVTPLRDGMNLVAKEYIAAQDPSDPGVLVLSKSSAAAEDFGEDALLVNSEALRRDSYRDLKSGQHAARRTHPTLAEGDGQT